MFTGDPGAKKLEDREYEWRDGYKYYTGGNADQYRAGVAWGGIDPLRFGLNLESIRHQLQNVMVHDKQKPYPYPRYTVLPRADEFYFFFGSGNGNTLW